MPSGSFLLTMLLFVFSSVKVWIATMYLSLFPRPRKMTVSQTSVDAAFLGQDAAPSQIKRTEQVNLFDLMGIENCTMECAIWNGSLQLKSQKVIGGRGAKKAALNKHLETSGGRRQMNGPNSKLGVVSRKFDLSDLGKSASKGCRTCAFFRTIIEKYLSLRGPLAGDGAVFQWVGYSYRLSISYGAGSPVEIQFLSPTWCKTPILGMELSRLLTGSTCSPIAFQRARRMINNCETNHGTCGVGRDSQFPKRLLDLSMMDQAESSICLVDTDDWKQPKGAYICLSHCWGKLPMPTRTLKVNLKRHLAQIFLRSIPRSFQEACWIAWRLEIRYIWIDSLCIIQDSAEDWAIESGKMADIYRNSYLTIAAVSSHDFRGGCLSTGVGDACLSIEHPDINTDIIVREYLPDDSPLLQRAWVYQERMLSRRILYCTKAEFQLECRESFDCECGNTTAYPHKASRGVEIKTKVKYHKASTSYNLLATRWHNMIRRYTALEMTFSKDTLPAISGCAKDIRDPNKEQYLAGLWRNTLCVDLIWATNGYCPRPDWRAPSWSWAAVDTTHGINYMARGLQNAKAVSRAFEKRLLEVSCEPDGNDETGQVKRQSAYLRIKSCLPPVTIRCVCFMCRDVSKSDTMLQYQVETTAFHQRSHRPDGSPPCNLPVGALDSEEHTFELYPDYHLKRSPELIRNQDDTRCRFIPCQLLFVADAKGENKTNCISFFLVLTKAAPHHELQEDSTYERIALLVVTFQSREAKEDWFERILLIPGREEEVFVVQ